MTETDDERVLVVDDEAELANLYTTFLEPEYDVVTATSGEDALDAVDSTVDVVLLDRRMPEMSGDEVLAKLAERGIDIQVAMLTAVEPERDIVDLPFDEYKTKPVTRDELLALVQVLLDRAEYDKHSQEFFSLAVKKATLEAVNEHGTEEYEKVVDRLDELREGIDMTLEEVSANRIVLDDS
ncbi:HalX domain-containing protein [Halovenus aranensis]|uniref:HalX domain-containing protein n=1 Tax=Halovenus aranensis TaxID=890420 RepID=A0A1G8UC02_9EURY|nr:response regulator [Halovenus aranensis]SDJ51268.1 HalX domain-containing protein [Halovenus aranensis]